MMKKEKFLQILLLFTACGLLLFAAVFSKNNKDTKEDSETQTFLAEEEILFEKTVGETDVAIKTIMEHGTKAFFGGKPVDEAFLLWLEEKQNGAVEQLSKKESFAYNDWYEITGKTLQVLWTEYVLEYGRESYLWEDVSFMPEKNETLTIDVIGDINLDSDWYTMKTLKEEHGKLDRCISKNLQRELINSDICVVNHEFTYGPLGSALHGKAYTFQANQKSVAYLKKLGVDIAGLANNHTWDYGEKSLIHTKKVLEKNGIKTMGAGNLKEARAIHSVIANGKKISFVAATEVEKYSNYTKDASKDLSGVYKMTDPEAFLETIAYAKKNSDYVIAYVHWGVEGESRHSAYQTELATRMVDAGADAIVGSHTHRLQGVEFIRGVPVVYGLGNFWFSTGTLFTSVAQIQIQKDGSLTLRMLPVLQKNVKTTLLTKEDQISRFYRYLTDMSEQVAITSEGECTDLKGNAEHRKNVLKKWKNENKVFYLSEQEYTRHSSGHDLDGRKIDVVGNLE